MATTRNLARKPLQEIVPIHTPFTAFIEPTNRCNFRCAFCPTSQPELLASVNRPVGDIPYDFACQIIDQFAQFPDKLKILNFQYMGEPLLHKRTPDMVAYAVDKDVADWYEIRTNGYLLNPGINRQLVNAGISRVSISVEAVSTEGYQKISGVKSFDIQRFVDNIADLHSLGGCEIYIKIDDINLTEDEKSLFFDLFSPVADEIRIEYLIDWNRSVDYDFTLGINSGKTVNGDKPHVKKVCCYPFYSLGVTWNGETTLCCVDWSYATSVGNAHETTLQDIWNGDRLYNFRKMHLENRRFENPACANCVGAYICPDNVDDFADEILLKLEQTQTSLA